MVNKIINDDIDSDEIESKEIIAILLKRTHEVAFILIIAVVMFLIVALASYHRNDPAWSYSATNAGVKNAAGIIGAYSADILLSIFGYLGYFLPIMFAGVCVICFKGYEIKTTLVLLLTKIIGAIITLVSGCTLANLHISAVYNVVPETSGGITGSFVQQYLVTWIGEIGATLLLISIFMAGITFISGLSWPKLITNICKILISLFISIKNIYNYVCKLSIICATSLFTYISKAIKISTKYFKKYSLKFFSATHFIFSKTLSLTHFIFSKTLSFLFNEKNTKRANEELFTPIMQVNQVNQVNQENIESDPLSNTQFEKEISPLLASKLTTRNYSDKSSNEDELTTNIKLNENLNTNFNKDFLPSGELLENIEQGGKKAQFAKEYLQTLSNHVEEKLADFGAEVKVVGVYPGPIITRFEIELKAGLKVNKITSLAKDLARSLSVTSLRVIEVIPGKSYVGLEIPNKNREIVKLREIVESNIYKNSKSPLTLALGKDIAGTPVIVDLSKMPHLLVAGTTGSGKSVGVNAMLLSILYKSTPDDVRLILIDPKMLELSVYESIPHLLTPVVTDMKDAANALNWCVGEMERRYQLMAAIGVRNLSGYNEKVEQAIKNKKPILDPLWHSIEGDEHPTLEKLPYIVVIIDEFADMMMVVGKKVEELIARIAQKARAAGIHMILATQRPSVDVITGIIKANIPTRIAFQVSSRIDSRTILDQMGAEQLLGNGDMLYLSPGAGIPTRVHGAFVSDQEVHNVVGYLKKMSGPQYVTDICGNKLLSNSKNFSQTTHIPSFNQDMEERDELYDEAVFIVSETRKTSISYIQRRLKIGFNRAARLLETMEQEGIISAMKSNGLREVLVNPPPE